MIDIFLTALPIYLMILVGYGAVKSGYIESGHIGALSQFVYKICLPALIFTAVAMPHGASELNIAFLTAYFLGSVTTMFLGFTAVRLVLRQPAPQSWILAMGMSNSNSAYLGFPIASLFFGADAGVVLAMTIIVETMVTLPLPMIAASASEGKGISVATLLKNAGIAIVQNPMVVAVVVAILVRVSDVPLADMLQTTVRMLAVVASPVALFVVGGTVARMSVSGHWRRAGAVTLGKLVLHPLLVALMLFLIPGVPASLIPVGIVFASVSILTIYPILAAPFGMGAVTSTALLATTALSSVTVSIVLKYLMGS